MGRRPRRAAVEGHLGAVRGSASRPRGIVRQLQVGQDATICRHRYGRRGRRARARRPRDLGHLSRAVPVARDDGAELRGRRRHERTPRSSSARARGIFQTRFGLAPLLGLPPDKIRVQYYAGSNTYGNSCYGEVANAAAILSQEVGRPVRLQFSREDEHGWDNYGPALLSDVRGAVDANGKLVALDYQAWGHADGMVRDRVAARARLAAADRRLRRRRRRGAGRCRALFGPFVADRHVRRPEPADRQPPRRRAPGIFETGALRAPMDPSTFFALEGMMDELAHAAKLDPYEFRKRNISHPRWLGVLEAAADAAKWTPRVAASNLSTARVVTGRGIGLGTHHLPQNQGDRVTYAAAVVEIEVNKDTGVVVAKHVYGAMDCGLAINPGIVESQIVGMSVHGASLALKRGSAIQRHERDEPRLGLLSNAALRRSSGRYADRRPAAARAVSSGAGEEVLPAVVAAIGNAFFDATGVRLAAVSADAESRARRARLCLTVCGSALRRTGSAAAGSGPHALLVVTRCRDP